MKKFTLGIVGLAVVALTLSVAYPASATPTSDQSQSGLSGGTDITPLYNPAGPFDVAVGSGFTAGISGGLTSISMSYSSITNPDSLNYEFKLWNVDGTGTPTGSPIATQVIPGTDYPTTASAGTIIVTFATPAIVAAGTPYAFTLGFVAGGTNTSSLVIPTGSGAAPSDKQYVGITMGTPARYTAGINFETFVDPELPGSELPVAELAKTGLTPESLTILVMMLMICGLGATFVARKMSRRQGSSNH